MSNSDVILDVKAVTHIFHTGGNDVRALDDISLHLVRGKLLMIMGPSGAGKSTLLQIIGGLLHPTEGTISYQAENIYALSEKRRTQFRRDVLGFIYQAST